MGMRIGIDAGGTFTDFVVFGEDGSLDSFKLRSDPRNPASVILEGLRRAAGGSKAEVIHGSTVATNALLERKGARTAFVTTAGFEDIVHIGRQNRAELYNLTPAPRRALAGRKLCFGVGERTWFDGTIAAAPAETELLDLKRRLTEAGVVSVALCFLHSYQNPANEQAAAACLREGVYLSASHEVCPEFREYERASTTLLNAYVGPLMDSYLEALERESPQKIWIMQSNGGLMTAAEARRFAMRTILSGPAGGVVGALESGRRSGFTRILGFDMGGTSTDVSLADGRPRETLEAAVDGFPVRVPMLDIHTVGAGGGSLARVDEGGLLRVGPESAGADPGPACYGAGDQPTVTDAHVALGRIGADQFLGGTMHLDVERAGRAVDAIAAHLRLSRDAAAAGILRVANANMDRAIRAVSIERGHDTRDFALVAFGGCGGLHACEIAAELGIRTVIVPVHAGALSALGMLLADRVRDYAAGVLHRGDVEQRFRALERAARKEMPGAGIIRMADIRYAGQSYELTVPWSSSSPERAFHREHLRVYGYNDASRPIEVVTARVRAARKVERPKWPAARRASAKQAETRSIYVSGRWRKTPVLARDMVSATRRPGPALVLDYGSTALIPSGWAFHLDKAGNLVIEAGRR